MATKKEEVVIKPIEVAEAEVTIEGDTSLIMHAWSEKAKKMMLDAQTGKKKGKQKELRNPMREFIDSLYWKEGKPVITDDMDDEECMKAFEEALPNAKFGFPVAGLKQSAISAAYRLGWTKDKMGLRGAFFIKSDDDGLIEIEGTPEMREDMVKIGMGTADLRYRGEFKDWKATFKISYNANGEFSLENILNALNAGGYVVGIGEWRPERDGQNGMFHVKTE